MALAFGHQLGIDIGAYSVKVVEMAGLSWRGPTIVRHCEEPFPSSPSELENGAPAGSDGDEGFDRSNPRMVGEFIGDVLDDHKIQRLRCVCSVPRHLAIVKTIEMPPADEVEIQQMARFQGEKEVPFPVDQCIMDYSVLSRKETGESTIVVVAVKSEVVEFYEQAAEAAKLKLMALEVSPFAHFNSPNLNALMGQDGITALLDIGGDTTEIAISRGAELVFTRSAFVGSEMLVKSLSTGTSVASGASLEEARQLLHTITENPTAPESESLRESPAFREWAARLTREMKRSLDSFNVQSTGGKVDRLVIAGGPSGIPALRDHLATELDVEVDGVDSSDELSRAMGGESRSFSLAAGLASRVATGKGRYFDLIHSSFAEKKRRAPVRSSRLVIPAIAAAVLLFALPIILLDGKKREIARIDNELKFLKPRSAKVEELRDKLRLYGPWTYQRVSWLDILREVSDCATEGRRGEEGYRYISVYVTDLSFRGTKPSTRLRKRDRNVDGRNLKLELSGRAKSWKAVEKFGEQLTNSPCFGKVDLKRTTRVSGKRGEPSGEDFKLIADVIWPESS